MLVYWLRGRSNEEDGQGLVEYALIIVLVSIVIIFVLSILGGGFNSVFEAIQEFLGF